MQVAMHVTKILFPYDSSQKRHLTTHTTHTLLSLEIYIWLIYKQHPSCVSLRLERLTLVQSTSVITRSTVFCSKKITKNTKKNFKIYIFYNFFVPNNVRQSWLFFTILLLTSFSTYIYTTLPLVLFTPFFLTQRVYQKQYNWYTNTWPSRAQHSLSLAAQHTRALIKIFKQTYK